MLLIGGLVALPYGAIMLWGITLWANEGIPAYARWSSIVVIALLIVPAVLPVTRALERTVAAQLLDAAVPEPQGRTTFADSARGALFFAGHIASGGILIIGIAFVAPLLVVLISDAAASPGDGEGLALLREAFSITAIDPASALIVCAVATVLIVGFTIGACYLLPWYATLLLGPSREEQRAREAEKRSAQHRRGALARDVHDSVGHALTISTMQAALARHTLNNDPDAARAALAEIERVSRGAVAELDYVLSVLRDGDAPRDEQAPDLRTLGDVERLVDETRSAGFDVDLNIDGDARHLPASLSREAYRVVQEGVTNALRYAAAPQLALEISAGADEVSICLKNETTALRAIDGRGLTGLRERVAILGGTLSVSIDAGRWLLAGAHSHDVRQRRPRLRGAQSRSGRLCREACRTDRTRARCAHRGDGRLPALPGAHPSVRRPARIAGRSPGIAEPQRS